MTSQRMNGPGDSYDAAIAGSKHHGKVKTHKGGSGSGHHRQHKERPCGNPPAIPTGVVLTFKATEALTHLRFTAKVKWNEVTTDEQGHGASIKRYDVQMVATDSGGTPVETEDSTARMRVQVKVDPTRFPIADASIVSGTTAEYVMKRAVSSIKVGDSIVVSGMKPTGYNGTYTVSAKPDSTHIRANIGTSPAASTEGGKMWEDFDKYYVISHTLPRPKTWYWKARVRAIDKDNCAGDWSDWTTPGLPWTGADPTPPVPTYGGNPIDFDNKGKGKQTKVRLKFTFNEVANFDYPGTPADDETDVDRYVVQLDRSDDGTSWDGAPYRTLVRQAKDADADTTVTAIFQNIRRRYWYRCRVRSVDRFNRKSAWSSWTSAALPFDDTQPPQPVNVRIFDSATDRVVLDWDDPVVYIATRGTVAGTSGTASVTGTSTKFTVEVEAGQSVRIDGNTYTVKKVTTDTALTLTANLSTSPSGATLFLVEDDPDVSYYRVQVAMSSNVVPGSPDDYNAIYAKDRTGGTRKAFKIPDADKGNTFYGRVQSVDAAYNKSKWIDGTTAGNSSPTTGGTGVVIGAAGSGKTKVVWHVMGRVRQLTEDQTHDYDIDEGLTLTKLRVRVKQVATGQAIKITPYKNGVALAQTTLAAGDRRVANDVYNTAFADSDRLSFSIDQVGSTFPGKQLTAIAIFTPT